MATRLAGSSDIFRREGQATTRSVNFIAAHDGLTLADLTSYERKHNEANGEQNRDGHNENLSWNNGVEGETADADDHRAAQTRLPRLLATLFASRGSIMLTAGDEFGRTQHGNNNAYAQDNEVTWLDWQGRDSELEAHVAALAAFRTDWRAKLRADTRFLDGKLLPSGLKDVEWLSESGHPLDEANGNSPTAIASPCCWPRRMATGSPSQSMATAAPRCSCVPARPGFRWSPAAGTERDIGRHLDDGALVDRRALGGLPQRRSCRSRGDQG